MFLIRKRLPVNHVTKENPCPCGTDRLYQSTWNVTSSLRETWGRTDQSILSPFAIANHGHVGHNLEQLETRSNSESVQGSNPVKTADGPHHDGREQKVPENDFERVMDLGWVAIGCQTNRMRPAAGFAVPINPGVSAGAVETPKSPSAVPSL